MREATYKLNVEVEESLQRVQLLEERLAALDREWTARVNVVTAGEPPAAEGTLGGGIGEWPPSWQYPGPPPAAGGGTTFPSPTMPPPTEVIPPPAEEGSTSTFDVAVNAVFDPDQVQAALDAAGPFMVDLTGTGRDGPSPGPEFMDPQELRGGELGNEGGGEEIVNWLEAIHDRLVWIGTSLTTSETGAGAGAGAGGAPPGSPSQTMQRRWGMAMAGIAGLEAGAGAIIDPMILAAGGEYISPERIAITRGQAIGGALSGMAQAGAGFTAFAGLMGTGALGGPPGLALAATLAVGSYGIQKATDFYTKKKEREEAERLILQEILLRGGMVLDELEGAEVGTLPGLRAEREIERVFPGSRRWTGFEQMMEHQPALREMFPELISAVAGMAMQPFAYSVMRQGLQFPQGGLRFGGDRNRLMGIEPQGLLRQRPVLEGVVQTALGGRWFETGEETGIAPLIQGGAFLRAFQGDLQGSEELAMMVTQLGGFRRGPGYTHPIRNVQDIFAQQRFREEEMQRGGLIQAGWGGELQQLQIRGTTFREQQSAFGGLQGSIEDQMRILQVSLQKIEELSRIFPEWNRAWSNLHTAYGNQLKQLEISQEQLTRQRETMQVGERLAFGRLLPAEQQGVPEFTGGQFGIGLAELVLRQVTLGGTSEEALQRQDRLIDLQTEQARILEDIAANTKNLTPQERAQYEMEALQRMWLAVEQRGEYVMGGREALQLEQMQIYRQQAMALPFLGGAVAGMGLAEQELRFRQRQWGEFERSLTHRRAEVEEQLQGRTPDEQRRGREMLEVQIERTRLEQFQQPILGLVSQFLQNMPGQILAGLNINTPDSAASLIPASRLRGMAHLAPRGTPLERMFAGANYGFENVEQRDQFLQENADLFPTFGGGMAQWEPGHPANVLAAGVAQIEPAFDRAGAAADRAAVGLERIANVLGVEPAGGPGLPGRPDPGEGLAPAQEGPWWAELDPERKKQRGFAALAKMSPRELIQTLLGDMVNVGDPATPAGGAGGAAGPTEQALTDLAGAFATAAQVIRDATRTIQTTTGPGAGGVGGGAGAAWWNQAEGR